MCYNCQKNTAKSGQIHFKDGNCGRLCATCLKSFKNRGLICSETFGENHLGDHDKQLEIDYENENKSI